MTKTWVTADLHFGHEGVCRFLRDDGTKLRPWDNADVMNSVLVTRWNAYVRPEDRVYVLGDVAMSRRHLHWIGRCAGRKVLVKGNHDIFKLSDYTPYFDDIRAYVVKKGVILSHIPIHPDSLLRYGVNVHGHLHANSVPDPRYVCVSVEQTEYRPILLQDAIDRALYQL